MTRIYNNNQAAIAQLTNQINALQAQVDSAVKSYKSTFTDSDLSAAGILIVTHNLGILGTSVSIFDNTGEQIYPGEILVIDANAIAIDFSAYTPINGTYLVLIYG